MFFTFMIVFWHFNVWRPIKHGYIAVEFFFILSGFLLYKNFQKNIDNDLYDAKQYTINKLNRMYIPYLLSCVFMFIWVIIQSVSKDAFHLSKIFKIVLDFIPEIFIVQSTGVFDYGANFPMWYFCILIVGGYILFALLKYNEKLTLNIISPLIILFTFSLIFNKGNSIESWSTDYILYTPLFRGLSDICIGALIPTFIDIGKNVSFINRNIKMAMLNLLSIFAFLSVIAIQFTEAYYDRYFLILIPIIIIACLIENSLFNKLFNNKIWTKLSKYTFYMFLIHGLISLIFLDNFKGTYDIKTKHILLFIYTACVIISSIIFHHLSVFIMNKIKTQCDFFTLRFYF